MNVAVRLVYHVPRSQVWPGSRGRQSGNTHLHVTEDVTLGRLTRKRGEALCAKRRGWYERPPEYDGEREDLCPRCVAAADRHGIDYAWAHFSIPPSAIPLLERGEQ